MVGKSDILDFVIVGISSATNDLNVGAAAVDPEEGPANTRFLFCEENDIVVFKEVVCSVLVLDCKGLYACTLTLVTVP